MPTVSFYLKNEDYDKWRALEKPGEFIHNALNFGDMVNKVATKVPKPAKKPEDWIQKNPKWSGPPIVQKETKPETKLVKVEHKTFFKDKKLNK